MSWGPRRLPLVAVVVASAHALPAVAQDAGAGGSGAPCAVPLAWRVTRVDREFGLDVPGATEVVREAAALWQNAADQPLFVHDESGGFPIRLVYDERQERNDARMRGQRALDAELRRLQATRSELEARSARLEQAAGLHREQLAAFEARVAAHNAEVREWNERGGAPPGTRTDLEAVGEALDAERDRLADAGKALEVDSEAIREEEETLRDDVEEYNRDAERHAREFPSEAVRSGEYREAVQRIGGRVAGISREIRIYRFASREELRLVAAHELGHALGLGHVAVDSALMSEEHDTGVHPEGIGRLDAADVALLASTCPGVVSEGR